MSEITRREILRRLALSFVAAGTIDQLAAQEVHQMVHEASAGRRYTPATLSAHEFAVLERVTDLIIPVEEGKPGAVQAEVAAWVDTLLQVNDELKARYINGLGWIDSRVQLLGAADFIRATSEQQTSLLNLIAYRRNSSSELDPGIEFFALVRRMTVDGFYTSRVGMRESYLGNAPQAEFNVPAELLDYALSRSPFQ